MPPPSAIQTLLIEASLIALVLLPLGIVCWNWWRHAKGAPVRRYVAWTGGLLALVLLGHLAGQEWWTYPFQRWDMYTGRTTARPEFVLIEAELQSGRVIEFPFSEICCVSTRSMSGSVINLARRLARAEREQDEIRAATCRADLAKLGDMLSRRRPDDPAVRLRFFECLIDLEQMPASNAIQRTLLTEVPIARAS